MADVYRCLGAGANALGGYRRGWQTFVIPGDAFWYRFSSSYNNDYWGGSEQSRTLKGRPHADPLNTLSGYKFKVKPVELRIDDTAAIKGLNFELGSWLFEFFLAHVPKAVKTRYIVDLYDAVVW